MVGHATVLEVVAKPAYWSPAAAAFVCQAWQFCAFVEKAHEYSLGERLRVARQQLTSLYDCATLLPDTEATKGDEPVTPGAPSQWPGFERFEAYWEVFDPYQRSTPVGGSLSDDVLDIYGDLRRGLSLWDTEASRPAALWDWRFHFEVHWGDHAVDALRALHHACKKSGG